MKINYKNTHSFFFINIICLLAVILLLPLIQDSSTSRKIKDVNLKTAKNNLPTLFIDLPQQSYQKIMIKREDAIRKKLLFSTQQDYVPATLKFNGRSMDIDIRLKGHGDDHWKDVKKWSFKIKIKDDKMVLGMKEFNIQSPETRGYITNWIYYQLAKYCGLITPRFDFINVVVNNELIGLYCYEEIFDKYLIENNRYREGAIGLFNDSIHWQRALNYTNNELPEGFDGEHEYIESFLMSPIDVYQSKKSLMDKEKSAQFNKTINLLEYFRRGKIPADQVFNPDKLAMLFAISDLMGNPHAHEFHNVKFYYNPVTSHLEPIGADNITITKAKFLAGSTLDDQNDRRSNFSTWEDIVFKDESFYKYYINALNTISNEDFLRKFFNDINAKHKAVLGLLNSQYPGQNFDAESVLLYNQKVIKVALSPVKAVEAYYLDLNNKTLSLQLGNSHFFPIEIVGVYLGDSKITEDKPFVLPAKKPRELIEFRDVSFDLKKSFNVSKEDMDGLTVKFHILGTAKDVAVSISKWLYLDHDFLSMDLMRQSSNYDQFEFITSEENLKEIYFKQGTWNLNKNLIIPAGFTVYAKEATEINVSNSAAILSYSPVIFVGTEEDPIIIRSEDFLGEGIAVLNATKVSRLSNVKFIGLNAPNHNGWKLEGSVNFYESDVIVKNCYFSLNKTSDDQLNIIRSNFVIEDSLFENSLFDAIDSDFSKGVIRNCHFNNIGITDDNGDAMDFSGSTVTVENVTVTNASDKGISAGERSNILVSDIFVDTASIAVASKDESVVVVKNAKIANCKTGLSAYQKKPEYGGGQIFFFNLQQKNINKLFEQDKISNISSTPN